MFSKNFFWIRPRNWISKCCNSFSSEFASPAFSLLDIFKHWIILQRPRKTNWVDNKCLVPIGSSLGQSLKRSPPAAVESTTVAPSTDSHTDKQWTEEMLSNLVDCGRTVEQIQQLSQVLTYPSLGSLIWVYPICLKTITIKCYSCFIRPEFDFQQACVEPSLRVKGEQG